jgi:hypothetical protein
MKRRTFALIIFAIQILGPIVAVLIVWRMRGVML